MNSYISRAYCNYNFNTKMYKQPNFPSFTLNTHSNWMDERVLTIMKKYEKPHHPAPKTPTHLHQQQYCHTPNQWKHSNDYSPINENHTNLDSDGYRADRRKSYKQQQTFTNYKQRGNCDRQQVNVAKKQREKRMYSQNQYQYFDQTPSLHYKKPIDRGTLNQISLNNVKRDTNDTSSKKFGYNQEPYTKYPCQEKFNDRYDQYETVDERYRKSPFTCKNQTPYYKQSDQSWVEKSCILNSKKNYVPKRQSNKIYTENQQLTSYRNTGSNNYLRYEKQKKDDVQYDKRISNIQRINNKIKKILSNVDHFQEAQPSTPQNKIVLKSLTPNKNIFSKEETHSRPKKEEVEKKLQKGQNQRSKSCIGQRKKVERTKVSDQANEKKFKKIQEQISSFNKRVALLAEEKKKLNIQLPTSISVQLKEPQQLQIKTKVANASTKKDNSKLQTQSKLSDKSQKHLPKKSLNNLVTVQSVHSLSEEQTKNNSKQNAQKDETMMRRRKQASENENYSKINTNSENFSESQFYQSTNELQQSGQGFSERANTETKLLLEHLSEQVKLDEQFRLTKNWFVYSDIHNQYEVLQSILGQRWRQMCLEQIQAEFSVNFEEDDPFYSYRSDQFVLQDMVNNYIICSKHWKEKIEGHWDTVKYIKEGLIDKLDLQNKGFVAIEDLVRILNMQEGTFYRNRDLYMIHQRLLKYEEASRGNLSIQVFNSILSKN